MAFGEILDASASDSLGLAKNKDVGETRSAEAATATGARLARILGAVALAAMVACQVMSGLDADPARFTEVIVALLAVSACCFAAAVWGVAGAAGAFGAAVLIGYVAELVGLLTGFPFGDYRYSGLLWPQVGGVPVAVALAWGGMGLAAYAVAAAIVPVPGWGRVAAGALALTAWDLFLDPQMVRMGLWSWAGEGPYRGIPVSNYAGWLLVSALVMLAIQRVTREGGPPDGRAPRGLWSVYATMAVMETVGFAAVFQPPDPLVAAVGGISMGALAALSWRRTWQG
ncbi:carotenoid biosynthesis protein [Nonomuraea thailandensis]